MAEIDLTPITRLEYDIDAILNDHAVAEPITRIELILADIVAGNTTTVEPVTRIETYLAIISGADYPVPEPVTRIETFLAIIAGEDYEEPEAVTRLEGLLAEWVEKGSGIWKTVTGTLIHLTDALASPMQKCEVTLEPIQDLHGQDAPYPAGGGKNKLGWLNTGSAVTPNNEKISYIKNTSVFTVENNLSASFGARFPNSCSVTLPAGTYYISTNITNQNVGEGIFVFNTSTSSILARARNEGGGSFTLSEQTTVGFGLNLNASTVAGVYHFQLELGSSATPYAPYSNICPITGWTGCEVNVANENLFDEVWELGTVSTSTGQNNPSNSDIRVKNYIPIKIGESFYLGWDTAQTGSVYGLVDVYKADKSFSRYFGAFTNPRSFTLNADEAYIRFYLYARTTPLVNAYIVYGTSSADYVPHQGTTASVTFPDTVYGGKYEFVSGGLKPYKEYDSYNGETLTGEWMSSMDKYVAGTTPTIGAQVVDLDSYDATVQLTPQPISTLAGENNVWSNSNGDTTIIYKAQAE